MRKLLVCLVSTGNSERKINMKTLLTTIAAVVLVGCATTQSPEPPTAKAPDISILDAAEKGNIEAVKQHLAAGADVNAKDRGWTPLLKAAWHGHKEIAELLIAEGADVNARIGGWLNVTPLHSAANKEIAEMLIANGADVNAKGWKGLTPLHDAASNKSHKETVELLLAKGADVNAKDVEGFTPLDKAALWDHKEIADLLVKHGGKSGAADSIHVAAAVGNIEAVKQHFDAGADVNAKMNNGSTSLHAATTKEVAELLIANGADVNAKTRTGRTPLHNGDTKGIVELLIANLLRKHGGKTGAELK